ncbi:hypothetical protein [Bradyrhizobium brasilense]|uniref:hypothetical protein n=1 Tax=Bradyrhizobium brasilense TaxID=1419277 RepID=UPI001E3C70C9|nr:hypothetical protein [Bradyrhizobium brasilense]MCC8976418.1 hypothetical protein [Bradyrhizobium brasilense]
MTQGVKNGLKATADANTGKMEIALIRDGKEICVTDIELSETCAAAGLLLGAAATASDQLPPQGAIPIISVAPTGYNFGRNHISGSDDLILYFGASALGIAIPRDHMAAIGQRLIALSAGGQPQ